VLKTFAVHADALAFSKATEGSAPPTSIILATFTPFGEGPSRKVVTYGPWYLTEDGPRDGHVLRDEGQPMHF
jgi:hypothetical protein